MPETRGWQIRGCRELPENAGTAWESRKRSERAGLNKWTISEARLRGERACFGPELWTGGPRQRSKARGGGPKRRSPAVGVKSPRSPDMDIRSRAGAASDGALTWSAAGSAAKGSSSERP
eukprot:8605121-Alexandrium_andersonii.AAC.2